MFPFTHFLAFSALALSVAECGVVFPAYQGVPATSADLSNFNGTTTNSSSIISTAFQVDQKSGVPASAPPNLPPTNTTLTAVDGNVLVNSTAPVSRQRRRSFSPRGVEPPQRLLPRDEDSDYELVFLGTGCAPNDRDASIEGTAYLTYTLVDNSTYNLHDCFAFCDTIAECVFVNLYYEYNNELLDHVFPEHSNLKCVAYGDVHTAQEKLNFGGQSLYGTPGGPFTYIQQSSGWSKKALSDPSTPDGYEPLPPLDGANEAPGYMGFVFLNKYDVDACAAECNARDPDEVGGACKYFNIWRALVDDIPTTYTCSMYYTPTDPSTAINHGQGNLTISNSRGYTRKTYLTDGGFEDFTCGSGGSEYFCFTNTTSTWLGSSPNGGYFDATIFHYAPYAHSGNGSALLGSAYGTDTYPGTLTSASALHTQRGAKYIIEFFHSSVYSGQEAEKNAFVEVYWSGSLVGTIRPGFSDWKWYSFEVVAQGDDELDLFGGSAPSFDWLDDINVFLV